MAAQLHSVTVTVDSIIAQGCYAREIFGCGKPAFAIEAVVISATEDLVNCGFTPAARFIYIRTPATLTCPRPVESPYRVVLSLYETDPAQAGPSAGVPAIIKQVLLGNANSNGALAATIRPLFGGTRTATFSNTNAIVGVAITGTLIPPTVVLDRPTSPFDPTVGAELRISGNVGYATTTPLRLVISGPGGTEEVFRAPISGRFDYRWDGRLGQQTVPDGQYQIVAEMVVGGARDQKPVTVQRAARPELTVGMVQPSGNLSTETGAIAITLTATDAMQLEPAVAGPVPLASTQDPCSLPSRSTTLNPQSVLRGTRQVGWTLPRAGGATTAQPGIYCLRIDAVAPPNRAVTVINGLLRLRVVQAGAITVFTELSPAVPSLDPGAPVRVIARAVDDSGRPRRVGRLTVRAAPFNNLITSPQFQGTTCTATDICSFDVPRAAFEAVAPWLLSDAEADDGAGGQSVRSALRLADLDPRFIGPIIAVDVPVIRDPSGPFRQGTRNMKDVALHAGTGIELATPAGRAVFSDAVTALRRVLFGGSPSVRLNSVSESPDQLGIWLARTPATVTTVTTLQAANLCERQGVQPVAFAETQAVIHRVNCRDNADFGGATFSTELASSASGFASVFWHELHHAIFDLADEYCCDGGYGAPRPFPNIFGSLAECQAGGAEPALCVMTLNAMNVSTPQSLWRSGPLPDVMVDNTRENADDLRRARFVFAECRQGRC